MSAQVLIDGLIAGSMIGLGAIGITLTYSILRFANFAHGELISWGAYAALAASTALGTFAAPLSTPIGPFSFGWALPLALVIAAAVTGILALVVDALLFGKLRQRGSASIILVMAGFGAALTLRSLLEFLFTTKPAYFTDAQRTMGDTSDFYRLFMVPGMLHCRGGDAPTDVDWLPILEEWVEHGKAPDTVTAKGAGGETQTLARRKS